VPFQEHSRVWERSQSRGGWGIRRPRGDGDEQPWRPLVTYWLLGIIVGVFVLQMLVRSYDRTHLAGIVWPSRLGDVQWDVWHPFLFAVGPDWIWRPWTLVTSTFSHGNFNHLFFNGLFLFFFGPSAERLLGARRYVALFLAGGALSGVVQAHVASWMDTGGQTIWHPFALALGASGALMVIFGVLIILTPRAQMFFMFLPVPMWVGGLLYAAMDALGIFTPDQVGHFAHLSGLALGLVYGLYYKRELARRGFRVVA
jgi:membrane associated rhomboid family serine protease